MKKIILTLFVVLSIFSVGAVYASSDNVLGESTAGQIIQIKEKQLNELKDYTEAYGSEAYGFTAYLLNKVRIYSIPLCFVGIAVGAIWQYVIGIRKLDVHDRGLFLIIGFVTIFVICQVLPLVFAIVVKGFRN
ncbi:MAG: hypothetical protein J6A04_02875 [Clostridia bacterium]|nr:hypothetical protein [Clostridia bacterium]